MKNIAKVLVIITCIGGLGFLDLSYAQAPADLTEDELAMVEQRREKREEMKAAMVKELGLTEEQQQKLEEHRDMHRKQIKEQKEAMHDLHEQLKAEIEKVTIDRAKIYSIHGQIKALNNEEADHRLEGMLHIRDILTSEQIKKFNEKFARGKGPRGRPGGPGARMPK